MKTGKIYKSVEGQNLVRTRYQEFLKRWPVANQQVRIETSEGETFVAISGPESAPALVLLHGGSANSAMWMGDIALFARSFRVYCVDMIGEPGFSAPVRPPLNSDAHALWLDGVLNHFSVARAAVVGISLGGWLALDYAIRRPHRVERLVAICPGGVGRQKVGIVFEMLLLSLFGERGKRKLMERILGRAPANQPPPVKAFLDFMALIQQQFRPRMVKMPVFPESALAKLKMPLLAIVGGRDVLLNSLQTKQKLERLVPQAQVVYLAEAGHAIVGQAARIHEFLTGDF